MRSLVLLVFLCSTVVYGQQDLKPYVLDNLGRTIYEGVFTGNGLLGTMTYQKTDESIRVDIGRTDVYDHRDNDDFVLFKRPRLSIGHFEISFKKNIQTSGSIDMQEASSTATIVVAGTEMVKVRATTLAEENIIIVDVEKTKADIPYDITFIPSKSESSRVNFSYVKKPDNYLSNPLGESLNIQDVQVYFQPMLAGGGYATAYKQIQKGLIDRFLITIDYDWESDASIASSVSRLSRVSSNELPNLLKGHRAWWNKYNQQSNYTIPDEKLQAFYQMQMYKLACATRGNKPAIDLQGPWTAETPWPGYWFNLNMQLTYSPLYTANRLNIAESLIRMIDDNKENLIANVDTAYQYNSAAIGRTSDPFLNAPLPLKVGMNNVSDIQFSELSNLTWLLYYYHQHYRYSMDKSLLPKLYDLLKRSVNYSIHFLEKNKAGKYEFVIKSHSPEYPNSYDYNTNYDLANLKWGLQTLLEMGSTFPKDKKYVNKLREIYDNLLAYNVDSNGYRISTNQGYDVSHRHYSHLLMIYPYYMIHDEQSESKDLIRRSIVHWQSKKGALQGYSLSGAASMYAMMKDGDKALDYLKKLHSQYIQPNTLYKESGPVIETPLAMANSLQELSLQYWNGAVRVFPAIPSTWKEVSFENFRTDGGFLVSANYKDGYTEQVKIFAEHSGVIRLKVNNTISRVDFYRKGKILKKSAHEITLKLPAGASAFIRCVR